MIIGIKAAAKLLKTTPDEIHRASPGEKTEMLKALAKYKAHGKEIEPCPRRQWIDCFQTYSDMKWYILHYHIKGDNSSRPIVIHY